MRKHLLLSLGLAVTSLLAYSQSNLPYKNSVAEAHARANSSQDGVPTSSQWIAKLNPAPPTANGGLRSLTETKFASSHNGFGLLVNNANSLTANTSLNLIAFTHRACESIVANGGNSGYIQTSFSKDGGLTFDTTLVIMNQTDYLCRYPAGGIVNPPGNSDPNMAFSVVSGPSTTSANGWYDYYYGSIRFDGDHNHQLIYGTNDNVQQWMPRYSFTTARDKAFVMGADWDYNEALATTPYDNHVVNRAVYNATTNEFDWTQIAIPSSYAIGYDGTQEFYNIGGSIAFNEDGSIGYVCVIGADAENPMGYYPIIWKSTDFGVTWTKQATFDFSTIPAWSDYLIPMTNGNYKPFFYPSDGIDMVVDGNNNLHIVCPILSGFSDNVDSLAYTFNASIPTIFDVYQYGDVWDITYVDTIAAAQGASAAWTSASGAVYTDARLQVSLTPNRLGLCVIWADTDPSVSGSNDYPDIFGKGINYDGAKTTTETINFTGFTNYAYSNSWMYVSDHAFDNGNGTVTVPVTVSKSRDESFIMDNVMDHYYVSDITLPLLTGIHEIANAKPALSASVYPNPVADNASIKINVQNAGSVNVKVSDIFGKEVLSNNYTYGAGNHFVNFDRSGLSNGVYFFTVTNGKDEVSGKLILQ